MYQYNNTLCISGKELIVSIDNPSGFLSMTFYKKLVATKKINVVRRGCKGTPALIEIESLPLKYREAIKSKVDAKKDAEKQPFRDVMVKDRNAVEFFTSYRLDDGRALPNKNINYYINSASILNGFKTIQANINKHKVIGAKVKNFWPKAVEALKEISGDWANDLPQSKDRLRKVYERYMHKDGGYQSLISRKFMNDNSRKVTAMVERVLLSIYAMPNKPFASSVHELYLRFIAGTFQIIDKSTGEILDRNDYFVNGQPIEISESTVWNYLNNPQNRTLVDKSRLDALDYNNTHRPHNRRHAPNFSFSKISMDDRDLPRKINNGKRVKAYYAYDVASGAVIGYSYSQSKDEELFLDCLRDVFRLIDSNSWGVPLEVEVENHLVNKYFDELAHMFPILRICAPGNSQEKRAEHFNRAKKYGTEKKTQTSIGRWWAKSEAYRIKSKKVNDEYVEPTYAYNTLVADDMQAIKDYNNDLHPKQKKYPGLSRWQVLCMNLNPQLPRPNRAVWMKSIGNRTETSIKRSAFLTVQHNEYVLPSPAIMGKLKPNNYTVDAYWLPNENGEVGEIYLYQHGEYLCRCEMSATYNEAKAERTDQDDRIFEGQNKYTGKFDKMVKEGRSEKMFRPELVPTSSMERAAAASAPEVPKQETPEDRFSLDDALNRWSGDWMSDRAIDDI